MKIKKHNDFQKGVLKMLFFVVLYVHKELYVAL